MQANNDLLGELRNLPRMADFFVEALHKAGCSHIFGLPAESLNPIIDAIRKHGSMTFVSVRHEANGALMASAFAKLSGRLSVCMGTAGPGSTHLPIGAYDARSEGAPMLVLSGQVWKRLLGARGFQEVDSVAFHRDATSLSRLIGSVEQTDALSAAIALAVNRSTAVHLALPSDVASARLNAPTPARLDRSWLTHEVQASAKTLELAQTLLQGQGPTAILLGASELEPRALEPFAAALGAPIFLLPEAIEYTRTPPKHPTVPLLGPGDAAEEALAEARCVVAIGRTSPTLLAQLAKLEAQILHLAPSHELHLAPTLGELRSCGSVGPMLEALLKTVRPGPRSYLDAAASVPLPALPGPRQSLWELIDRAVAKDATIALEPGAVLRSAFVGLPAADRRIVSSFHIGAEGFALPAAIAGALARPQASSLAVATPAGLAESMVDLLTACKYKLGVRVLCVPNDEPAQAGAVDFASFARSAGYGVHRVQTEAELEAKLRDDRSATAPTFLSYEPQLSPEAQAKDARPVELRSVAAPADALVRVLIEALVAAKVSHLFGRPRPEIEGLIQELRVDGRVEFVPVSQSESASMMASAHAKWTQTLGVCVAANPSDLLLQLNGLYDASFDHAPVLILTPTASAAIDPIELLRDVALSSRILDPARPAAALAEVTREAYRRQGVTQLALAWDTLSEPAAPLPPWFVGVDEVPVLHPDPQALREAIEALDRAKQPAILVGRGAIGRHAQIEQLAEILDAPILSTMPGRAAISADHPRYVGAIGSSGHRSAIRALEECDLLVSVGCSSRGAVYGFVGGFTIIQIDHDALELGRRPFPTIGLCGSAAPTLALLSEGLSESKHARRKRSAGAQAEGSAASRSRELRREFEGFCADNQALTTLDQTPIRPPAICAVLHEVLGELGKSAVLTVDVGVTTLWVYRHFIGGDHSIVWTSSFATMGFALPAAIAIASVQTQRPVIAMAGDGGIGITMAELASAVARDVPVVAIVFNNGKLAAIKYEQEVMGWPEYEAWLHNPDFAEYARSCGAHGIRVSDPNKLADALREALTCGRPCIVDVVCDPHDLPAPPKIHPLQAMGYLLATAREGREGLREMLRQAGKLVGIKL